MRDCWKNLIYFLIWATKRFESRSRKSINRLFDTSSKQHPPPISCIEYILPRSGTSEKRDSHTEETTLSIRDISTRKDGVEGREENVFLFLRLRLRFYLQTFQGVLRFVVCRCRIEYIGNDISVNRKSRTGRGVNHASFEGMRGSATSFSARKGWTIGRAPFAYLCTRICRVRLLFHSLVPIVFFSFSFSSLPSPRKINKSVKGRVLEWNSLFQGEDSFHRLENYIQIFGEFLPIHISPQFSRNNLINCLWSLFCICSFIIAKHRKRWRVKEEEEKEGKKKRWRNDFVLISVAGKRRLWWYAPLVVEGEDWSCGRIRQSCKKSNEKELKSRRGSGERGSFNGFRKKETAGRSSGREKGENKI